MLAPTSVRSTGAALSALAIALAVALSALAIALTIDTHARAYA